MKSRDAGTNIKKTCQFLGTVNDPLVSYYFPNRLNFCNRIKKPEPINLHHQGFFCLTGKHTECIVYIEESIKHLPDDILGEIPEPGQKNPTRNFLFFMITLIVFVTFMTIFLVNTLQVEHTQAVSTDLIEGSNDLNPSNTSIITVTQKQIDLLFLLPIKTEDSEQPLSLETQTQSPPTPGPGFSTPFGINQKYLLHEVKPGESLLYIADLYSTTVDAIIVINSLEGAPPIQVDQVIIVKPGATINSTLSRLDAILFTEVTQIKTITENYSTTIETLINLNDLGDSEMIPAGRWLIVPNN